MVSFYQFLALYEGLIYLVLAFAGVFAVRWFYRAWRSWREAVYSLEREFSQRRFVQSVSVLAVIFAIAIAEFILVSFVIPSMPALYFVPTPTLNIIITPTGTITSQMATYIALTPTQQPADLGGCVAGELIITSPKNGDEISGTVELIGTVNIADFGFYKYEAAPQGSESWATISAGRDPVIEDSLGLWDTSALTPGDYSLRILVIDNAGSVSPPCEIQVRVKGVQ